MREFSPGNLVIMDSFSRHNPPKKTADYSRVILRSSFS
jgi:hypothetical protein